MLADPPQLVGKRVRFIAVVKDRRGEAERARARVWTDGNIETYRNMGKEQSRTIAQGFIKGFVSAVGTGDIGVIPKMMNAEGY